MRQVVGAELDAASVPDESGDVRVVLMLPIWSDFLRIGLDDICRAAADSPMVLARAVRLLHQLMAVAPPGRAEPLQERLAWVEAQLGRRHPLFMRGAA